VGDPYWDPFDKALDVDPYPAWRRLRDEAPVYRNDRFDFYALSRHDDIDAAHRDPVTFSSAYGTVLEIMSPEPMDTGFMIFKDQPAHTAIRLLVSRAFTPRRIAELEPYIRSVSAELLDPHIGSSGFDYVQEFSAQLPSRVISELLGVDPADREEIRRTIDQAFHIDENKGIVNDISFGAQIKLYDYFGDAIESRRAKPRDDMMTALVEAEMRTDDGGTRRLTNEEATDFACLLVSTGTETVARLVGWAGLILAEHPEARADLADDPGLLPNAVEELLRYAAPSAVQGRTAVRDVELHGVTIPAKAKVLLLTASAGRDERKFDDPDRFDIRRKVDGHVSLGHGIHFCLGAALARMETRVALEETLRRFPTWDVDPDGVEMLHTSTVRGHKRLPITL